MAITGCELFYVNYKVNLTIKIRHCNEKNGEKRERKKLVILSSFR